ncbi:MAG: hypothetical protein ABIG80_00550 [Patescibacteria group bacterium]
MTVNSPETTHLQKKVQAVMTDILQHAGSKEQATKQIRAQVTDTLLKDCLHNDPWIHWNPYDQIREGGISFFSEKEGRYVAVYTGELKFKPRNS